MTRISRVLLLGASVIFCECASGQHKLLLTDVLDRGETEILVSAFASEQRSRLSDSSGQFSRTFQTRGILTAAAYGLADGIELQASVPYVSQARLRDVFEPTGTASVRTESGFDDVFLGTKFALWRDPDGVSKWVAGASITPETANNELVGSKYASLSGFLAYERRLGPVTRGRVALGGTIRNKGRSESVNASIGIEQRFSEAFDLLVVGSTTQQGEDSVLTPVRSVAFSLEGHLRIVGNWYLVPELTYRGYNTFTNKTGNFEIANARASYAALGLYRLF